MLLRGYHASEASFFSHFVERVHADPRFAATASTAIEEAARWLFAFVGALSREIAERYAEERERWIRSTAAARLRDVRAVLSAEATDATALSTRLRYPLDADAPRRRAVVRCGRGRGARAGAGDA